MAPPCVEIPGSISYYDDKGEKWKNENFKLALSSDFMISV